MLDNNAVESVPCVLVNLPTDLRRILRVQFKEFIHSIEDVEVEKAQMRQACIIYLLRPVRSSKAA